MIVPLEPGQRPEDVAEANNAVLFDLLASRANAMEQLAGDPNGKVIVI